MRRMVWLLAVLMVLALPVSGTAQTGTGRVTGVIVDPSGGVLPGVTVTIRSASTNVVRSTVTDSVGRYVIDNLAPGTYELTVELPGFTAQTSSVVVSADQPVNLDVTLQMAGRSEQVQVTGTLIPRPTIEAMSPVTTMGVEELTYQGMTRIEDLLTSLPQVFNAQNSTIANGASGTATVDLRYLGTVRTLVLIDGRRMSSGDAFATAPDLNFIPSALVKRVDVLTGGASSVYGADAVAGVVNFILDKDFEGFKGGIQFTGLQHNNSNTLIQAAQKAKGFDSPVGSLWGGATASWNVALGSKFAEGKGHASVYLDYRNTSKLLKADRDYTACSIGLGASGPTCSGSSTVPNGRFLVFSPTFSLLRDLTLDTSGPGNTMRNRTGADVYNYGPLNFMQRPDKRWLGGGFANFQWNQHAEGYTEVMLMDDYTDAQIAPSGDFGNTSLLNCDNPMLSDQQRQIICTDNGYGPHDIANVQILKRNVEGGPRVSQLRHTDFRLIAGLKGDINNAWSYDVYGMDAEVHSPQSYLNDLNVNRLQDALIVDGDPNDPSTWQCRSGNPGCVPWNIFSVGGVTQDALDYLSLPLILNSGTKTQLVSGKLTGDLKDYGVVFPSASEGIQLAAGAEYRKEFLFVNPDQAYRDGIGSGQGGPTLPIEGNYDVKEFFTEALIPIIQDASKTKDLSLELGYRLSDYSTAGRWPTYKVQASWAPVSDVKLRVGFNRATRAPNVQELFVPQGLGLGGNSDICAGSSPTATQAQCALTGVSAAQYGNVLANPADQYNTIGGGNVDLNPEVADTITGGLVVTPSALPGFTFALDYFNIKIKDTIGSLGADDIINACATTGDSRLCSLIHRDVAGTLWLTQDAYTITTNQNIGQLSTEGVDANVTYARSVGEAGTFTVNLIGTYLTKSMIDTGLYSYDCVGYFGVQCGIPTPKWRHLSRVSWQTPFNAVFSLGWRMIGGVTIDDASPNDALADPGAIELWKINDTYHYNARHYLDLAATYTLRQNVQLVFGVNNIFDKEPPLGPSLSANDYGPGFYGTYDPYGRYVHSALQFTF